MSRSKKQNVLYVGFVACSHLSNISLARAVTNGLGQSNLYESSDWPGPVVNQSRYSLPEGRGYATRLYIATDFPSAVYIPEGCQGAKKSFCSETSVDQFTMAKKLDATRLQSWHFQEYMPYYLGVFISENNGRIMQDFGQNPSTCTQKKSSISGFICPKSSIIMLNFGKKSRLCNMHLLGYRRG